MSRFAFRGRVRLLLYSGIASALIVLGRQVPARTAGKSDPEPVAVERARDTVRMLDDIYKGYVVHITETYVKARETTPAARVTKKVWKQMEAKGWHTGRIVDAAGEPVNPANVAKTDFEKRAVAKIKAGNPYYDEVGEKDGKATLRAATVLPVVMDQCINRHPGYKKGDVLWALVYEVPIK
jgi:hypothetical protein